MATIADRMTSKIYNISELLRFSDNLYHSMEHTSQNYTEKKMYDDLNNLFQYARTHNIDLSTFPRFKGLIRLISLRLASVTTTYREQAFKEWFEWLTERSLDIVAYMSADFLTIKIFTDYSESIPGHIVSYKVLAQ